MRFSKLGLVYGPDGRHAWARSYALAPTPVLLGDGLRVYFASCDEEMVGSVGFVELDPEDPTRVLRVADRPVLAPGEPGCFDDNGVNATSLVTVGDELWLYYFGYQLHRRVRYTLFAGLAVSRDGGETFRRYSQVPILERSDGERFVRSAPFVRFENGRFRMWYVSGDEWIEVNGKPLPRYGLRYLESDDGRRWGEVGRVVLSLSGDDEHGFGRPYVVKTGSGYRLWYSLRSKSKGYRIGMAESPDGLAWTRRDAEVDLDVSPTGWDSEIVCYGAQHENFLFYNGNGYGRDGFGIARIEGGAERGRGPEA